MSPARDGIESGRHQLRSRAPDRCCAARPGPLDSSRALFSVEIPGMITPPSAGDMAPCFGDSKSRFSPAKPRLRQLKTPLRPFCSKVISRAADYLRARDWPQNRRGVGSGESAVVVTQADEVIR